MFLKHFVSEGTGHLVNVSSALSSSSRPTAYAATQRAIEVLSDALAAELADTEVLVSCIQPGLVKTGVHHRWEIEGSAQTGYTLEPEDFARMVLFILEQHQSRQMGEMEKSATATDRSPEFPADAFKEGGELGEADSESAATEDDDASEEGIVQDEI